MGPRTLPWGIPEVTGFHSDLWLPKITLFSISEKVFYPAQQVALNAIGLNLFKQSVVRYAVKCFWKVSIDGIPGQA